MHKLTLPQFIYFRHLRTYKRNKATLLHEELLLPVTGFRPPGLARCFSFALASQVLDVDERRLLEYEDRA